MHRFEQCQSTESIWEEPERGTFFGTTLRSMQQPMRQISWAASLCLPLPVDKNNLIKNLTVAQVINPPLSALRCLHEGCPEGKPAECTWLQCYLYWQWGMLRRWACCIYAFSVHPYWWKRHV